MKQRIINAIRQHEKAGTRWSYSTLAGATGVSIDDVASVIRSLRTAGQLVEGARTVTIRGYVLATPAAHPADKAA